MTERVINAYLYSRKINEGCDHNRLWCKCDPPYHLRAPSADELGGVLIWPDSRKAPGQAKRQGGFASVWFTLLILIGSVVVPVLNKGNLQPLDSLFAGRLEKSKSVTPPDKMRTPENVLVIRSPENEHDGFFTIQTHISVVDNRIELRRVSGNYLSPLHGMWSEKEIALSHVREFLTKIVAWWNNPILKESPIEPNLHFFSRCITCIFPFGLHREVGDVKLGARNARKRISAMRGVVRVEGDRWGDGLKKYESARSGGEFLAGKVDLAVDETRLALRDKSQGDCEESYKYGGDGRHGSIVGVKPNEPTGQLTHSELILVWVLILSPFIAGISAGYIVYDVYRITKTIDRH